MRIGRMKEIKILGYAREKANEGIGGNLKNAEERKTEVIGRSMSR